MAALGFKNYRFSVSWPRVIPSGDGPVNAKGLQFYSDLVDELLKHKIEPFVYAHTHTCTHTHTRTHTQSTHTHIDTPSHDCAWTPD